MKLVKEPLTKSNYFKLAKSVDIFSEDRSNNSLLLLTSKKIATLFSALNSNRLNQRLLNQSFLKQTVLISWLLIGLMSEVHAAAQWELGMGVGHLTTNAYIGSSEQISLTTLVPFIKLKTDWFDLSEGSLKMKWFEQTPFSLSFNFDLGLPVDSSDVEIRQGMDDLDPVLQFGPMLSYQLEPAGRVNWKIELPLVYAFSIDGGFESQGWRFTPRVAMRFLLNKTTAPLDLEISLGPVYGAKKIHQYYYSVLQNEVTADRGFYDAEGGYAGYRLNMSLTKRVDDIWFGLYLRYHNLSGAEFNDSPLVDQDDYWLVTFAISYIFASNP